MKTFNERVAEQRNLLQRLWDEYVYLIHKMEKLLDEPDTEEDEIFKKIDDVITDTETMKTLRNDLEKAGIDHFNSIFDFKIDDPVMVLNFSENTWVKRHFAGIGKEGKPMAFIAGLTSFTSTNPSDAVYYDKCRRPTKEELNDCQTQK